MHLIVINKYWFRRNVLYLENRSMNHTHALRSLIIISRHIDLQSHAHYLSESMLELVSLEVQTILISL